MSCPHSMPTKYRPITQKEKVKEIGIGLLLALIFAPALGGIVQLLFQWGGGFFDPAPNAPPDCKFSDFFDGSVGASDAYKACKDQSNSFPIRMERLSNKIPWFWIAFVLLGWAFNRIWMGSCVVRYRTHHVFHCNMVFLAPKFEVRHCINYRYRRNHFLGFHR